MSKYLSFNRVSENKVNIWHNEDDIEISCLEYIRVGAWMSWCITYLHKDYYLSASCTDEIRLVQKTLNANKYADISSL